MNPRGRHGPPRSCVTSQGSETIRRSPRSSERVLHLSVPDAGAKREKSPEVDGGG
jgi:hypothetical protein